MTEETTRRALIVCKELYRIQIEMASGVRPDDVEFERTFKDLQGRPRAYRRVLTFALQILYALDEPKEPVVKHDLTGDQLWESIVHASKP